MDDAHWGLVPFHYGRWVILDGTWWWVPGPMRIRAIYAPALIVFVGGGVGFTTIAGSDLDFEWLSTRAERGVHPPVSCEPCLHHQHQYQPYGHRERDKHLEV